MKRREFIQYGSLASMGIWAFPFVSRGFSLPEQDPLEVKKVHLVFKTHLDVGFTNFAENVIKTYMNEFIPGAISLSESLRNQNQENRYIWTTGSWLINEFLEKSDPSMRKRMETAIERGDMAWHGLPFTTHSELADESLFDLGIQVSKKLDRRFGIKTIAAKMTDVPGHTRGIVPVLAKNNIEFLHIGVNSASTPPDVPPLFVWKAPGGEEIILMYQKSYGSQMILPGGKTAVEIYFTSDNHGPHKPEQIAKKYDDLRKQFPNAEVKASTLNDIAADVLLLRDQLPVVTGELGDTWIHGAASDPYKIARFRELSRLRREWLQKETLRFGSPEDLAFGIPLLMIAEHTWGLDVKRYLKDWDIYTISDVKAARSKPNFKMMEKSWNEKRQYIDKAIGGLPGNLAEEAGKKLEALKPAEDKNSGFIKITDLKKEIDTPFFKLKIDPKTGSIIQLTDKTTGTGYAGKQNPLCLFSYQNFSQKDFDRFHNQYLTKKPEWALGDFGKPGLDKTGAVSETWPASLKSAGSKNSANGLRLFLDLAVAGKSGKTVAGSPERITVELFFPAASKELQATLQWFGKPANRLPEASWFSFVPPVRKGSWIIDKMGQPVNFRNVVKDGNRKLHASINGIRLQESTADCSIVSPDAPLVAPGERNLLNFDNRLPEVSGGVHFCLHNNVWGTNFAMWFDEDMKYRFVLKV